MTSDERQAQLAEAIEGLADAEGVPVAVRHICAVCVAELDASGVALYLSGLHALIEPVYATHLASEGLAEAQAMLGDGPAWACRAEVKEVSAPDLADPAEQRRWPLFAGAAARAGLRFALDLPVVAGGVPVAVLSIHRRWPGGLPLGHHQDARRFAALIRSLLLEHATPDASDTDRNPLDRIFSGRLHTRWTKVHQASGIAAAQLGTDMTEALLRLRATALATGRALPDVADEVLTGARSYQSDRG
ncbi:ANTAR domain-containing protein [Amycolatopsis benzoatilytica]|uniref:ANTAR domain-containing protein n=1 Tax=Amycolatopsis benzoatilytica TaxID=346045 RepID=UPI0012B68189|nr:ANTAR domain-containing protein [Amycolatopsis benzoatilytica]